MPTGPGGCRNNCVETLKSSLGPADVFPATFEPTVPPVWWHSLFPSLSAGCCSHPGALGGERRAGDLLKEQSRCLRLRWTQARIWSKFLSVVSDDESASCICCAGFLTADLPGRQQTVPILCIAGFWLYVSSRDPPLLLLPALCPRGCYPQLF